MRDNNASFSRPFAHVGAAQQVSLELERDIVSFPVFASFMIGLVWFALGSAMMVNGFGWCHPAQRVICVKQ